MSEKIANFTSAQTLRLKWRHFYFRIKVSETNVALEIIPFLNPPKSWTLSLINRVSECVSLSSGVLLGIIPIVGLHSLLCKVIYTKIIIIRSTFEEKEFRVGKVKSHNGDFRVKIFPNHSIRFQIFCSDSKFWKSFDRSVLDEILWNWTLVFRTAYSWALGYKRAVYWASALWSKR